MSRKDVPWTDGKAPPPVAERPRCANCGKPRQPQIWNHTSKEETDEGWTFRVTHRTFAYYKGYGDFCTLRCAQSFAQAAFDAGYRRVKK